MDVTENMFSKLMRTQNRDCLVAMFVQFNPAVMGYGDCVKNAMADLYKQNGCTSIPSFDLVTNTVVCGTLQQKISLPDWKLPMDVVRRIAAFLFKVFVPVTFVEEMRGMNYYDANLMSLSNVAMEVTCSKREVQQVLDPCTMIFKLGRPEVLELKRTLYRIAQRHVRKTLITNNTNFSTEFMRTKEDVIQLTGWHADICEYQMQLMRRTKANIVKKGVVVFLNYGPWTSIFITPVLKSEFNTLFLQYGIHDKSNEVIAALDKCNTYFVPKLTPVRASYRCKPPSYFPIEGLEATPGFYWTGRIRMYNCWKYESKHSVTGETIVYNEGSFTYKTHNVRSIENIPGRNQWCLDKRSVREWLHVTTILNLLFERKDKK